MGIDDETTLAIRKSNRQSSVAAVAAFIGISSPSVSALISEYVKKNSKVVH